VVAALVTQRPTTCACLMSPVCPTFRGSRNVPENKNCSKRLTIQNLRESGFGNHRLQTIAPRAENINYHHGNDYWTTKSLSIHLCGAINESNRLTGENTKNNHCRNDWQYIKQLNVWRDSSGSPLIWPGYLACPYFAESLFDACTEKGNAHPTNIN